MSRLRPQPVGGATEGSMDTAVARTLAELRAAPILIVTAIDGLITELACAMPVCLCPQGRAYFQRRGDPRYGPWAPSADRFPVPGRDGGEYVPANVRLAHKRCNQSEGGKYGGRLGAILQPLEAKRRGGTAGANAINATWAKTPAGHAQKVRNGKIGGAKASAARKASGQYQSDEMRELGRRLSLKGVPALREWRKTPEAHEVHVAVGRKLAAWMATPEGRAKKNAAVRAAAKTRVVTSASKANQRRLVQAWANTPDAQTLLAENGRRTGCLRWAVNRGRPCTCGHH